MNISIVIPTLDEEKIIDETLRDLVARHGPCEIIVADGGSTDRTCQLAEKYAKVIRCRRRGRASQMNEGARHACGKILLFLHADTLLPPKGLQKIKEAVGVGNTSGRFRDSFYPSSAILKFYAFFTRFHFFSYGDQGLFLTRDLFDRLRGFSEVAPFEDMEFYARLRRIADPIIIEDAVATSARRFVQRGAVKQGAINLLFIVLYQLGCHMWLRYCKERWYRDIR